MLEKLFKIKEIVKKKKQDFKRKQAGKKKRLSFSWRRPRGWQNKQRKQKKGNPPRVEVGYGSPKQLRGYTRKERLKKVLVRNLKDLEKINPKQEGIVISSTLGLKKKIQVYKIAKERGITIIEPKESFLLKAIKEREEEMKKKKEEKKKVTAQPQQVEKEEKQEQEKKEKDKKEELEKQKEKILTKRV